MELKSILGAWTQRILEEPYQEITQQGKDPACRKHGNSLLYLFLLNCELD